MKIKIGTRTGEITTEYFLRFGKNKAKFGRAIKIMFPQAQEAHIDDIWKEMGGEEKQEVETTKSETVEMTAPELVESAILGTEKPKEKQTRKRK